METPWTMRRIALATLTIIASAGVAWALYQVRDSLIIVFIGILFGMAMKGPVLALQRLYVPRWLALVLVLLVVLAVLPVAVLLLLPTLINAVTQVIINAIQGYDALLDRVNSVPIVSSMLPSLSMETVNESVVAFLTSNSETLIGSVLGVGTTIVGTLINLVTIITIGFLWILEEDRIRAWLIDIAPSASQVSVQTVWRAVEAQVGGYLRGLLVLSFIVGVLCSLGYGVIGLRLTLAFGILAGLMEIIPIPGVGLTLQAIIVGLATLPESPTLAVGALIWTVIVFQAANMILFPRIMGDAVGISALSVIIALVVFVSLLGGVGALLAIPLASIIQIIVNQTLLHTRGRPAIPSNPVPPPPLTRSNPRAALVQARAALIEDSSLNGVERQAAIAHIDAALEAIELPKELMGTHGNS